MSTLDRDGATIHYEICGDVGPVVLLTHGFSSRGAAFDANRAPIVAAGYRVITWDLRGHGETDAGDDRSAYTVSLALADMAALLDVAGAERAVLGGHSLGGYLSLAFRIAHPQRVAALVLIDTGPGYRDDDARAGWNRMIDEQGPALASGNPPEAVERMLLTAEGILKQHDSSVIDSLPDVAVPTLVIVGEKDKPFRGGSSYMSDKIAGAELVVIEGAGHSPFASHRAEFDHAMCGFLSRLEV